MRRILALLFVVSVLTACGPAAPLAPARAESTAQPTLPATATPEPTATPVPPTPTQEPARYNFVVLGGDMGSGRPQNAQGGGGDKTDVILLVSIHQTNPADVVIIEFPRNLYSPDYPDPTLLFRVYRDDGFSGIHEYFYKVFGITIQGVAYVDMGTFVEYVDAMGGVDTSREAEGCEPGMEVGADCHFDGTQLLAWLRDNDNNWGHGVYDAGMRQQRALVAILGRVRETYELDDLINIGKVFKNVETDLGPLQIADAVGVAITVEFTGYSIRYERLATPNIERGDVPVDPYRAEVAQVDLKAWMDYVLNP